MIKLYKPKPEDLWFRERLLGDPETMSYNRAWGGAIAFPRERWADWHRRWVACPEGRFYRYLRDDVQGFVGETAYHYDGELGCYLADVIVMAQYRGRGFGSAGLDLLCAAAKENGVPALYDNIARDNPSVAMFLKNGFSEEYRTDTIIMVGKSL